MTKPKSLECLRLRGHAEDALKRDFAIFPCLPKGKKGMAGFGCYDSSRTPAIALRAWDAGHEANIGISCPNSNLVVVDCDHGLQNYEHFENWRQRLGFPRSYTVRTGAQDEYRVHVYYRGIETDKGTVPLYPYTIDGVSGEIRGAGCLVIGAGSRHESGNLYHVIDDLEPVPTPSGLISLIPEPRSKDAEPDQGTVGNFTERIPEGRRWFELRKLVGSWRNDGAEYETLLAHLHDARENICDPGKHPIMDLELKNLAKWGAGLPIGRAKTEPAILTPEGGVILYHTPTTRDKIVTLLETMFETQRQWQSDEAWTVLESRLSLDRTDSTDRKS